MKLRYSIFILILNNFNFDLFCMDSNRVPSLLDITYMQIMQSNQKNCLKKVSTDIKDNFTKILPESCKTIVSPQLSSCAKFSACGRYLVMNCDAENICIYNLYSKERAEFKCFELSEGEGKSNYIKDIAFSNDGKKLAVCSYNIIKIYDWGAYLNNSKNLECIRNIFINKGELHKINFVDNGPFLLNCPYDFIVWDLDKNYEGTFIQHNHTINEDHKLCPDVYNVWGDNFVSSEADKASFIICHIKLRKCDEYHDDYVIFDYIISDFLNYIIVLSNGNIHVFDKFPVLLNQGNEICIIEGEKFISALFCTDINGGKYLIAGLNNGDLKLFDLKDNFKDLGFIFKSFKSCQIECMGVSPCRRYIVVVEGCEVILIDFWFKLLELKQVVEQSTNQQI